MNSKKILTLILLTFLSIGAFAQGTLCSSATPFCTAIGTPFTYQNVTGTATGQAGPNYGCLLSQPRPSWFYIKSSAAGAMTFSLTQSTSPGGAPNIDVDFIAYGPYSAAGFGTACSNLTGGCTANHNCAGNTEDCSYSPLPTETMTLNPTAAGQYFIIMITNFAGTAGFITFTQTGGPASDCSITCPSVISGDGITLASGSNIPSTITCGTSPFSIMASTNSPFGTPIVPGIMVNVTTNASASNNINWSENGSLIANIPLTASTNYDYQLYYSSPTATTSLDLCETASANPNMGYSIMDLASGNTIAFGTWTVNGVCQTVTLPPGAITGVASFSGSCGSCVTTTDYGYGAFYPNLAGVGTHTITYSFNPGGSCATYTFSKVLTVSPLPVTTALTSTTICQGASTTLTVSGGFGQTFTTSTSAAIPDNNATGVSSPLVVSGLSGNVSLNLASVKVNITHTWDADLSLFLVCPSGYSIALSQNNGGSGDNYTNTTFSTTGTSIFAGTAPFTGTFIPESSLSFVSGCSINGTWNLVVKDNTTGDIGTVTGWSMTFTDKNTYAWTPTASLSPTTGTVVVASPTTTTVYTVTATNPGACSGIATVTVNVNPKPTLTITPAAPVVCAGSTVSLTGSGASTYTWTGGITNGSAFTPTATTSYTVNATSAAGCTNTAVASVSVNASPTVAISSVSSSSVCSGNPSVITPSGASTYTLINTGGTGTSFTVNPTGTTTYSIIGASGSGCASGNTITATVNVNTTPTVAISAVSSPTLCSGNTSVITPSGASTYTLLNSGATGTSFTVSPTGNTTYSIVGASALGCASGNTITTSIAVNTTPTVAISTVSSPTLCSGNNSVITPSGASTYTLLNTGGTGTSFTVSPTGNTTYSIVGSSASACASTNTITTTITVNTTPTVAIASVSSPTLCSGNTSVITPSGASTYTLLNSGATGTSFTVSPGGTTTYSIIGTSAAACPSTNTITTTITVGTTPTIAIASVSSPVICSGNTSVITPSGASTYTLINSGATGTSFTVNPTTTTTYSVRGVSAGGCPGSNTITTIITVNTTPTVAIASVSSPVICSGNTSVITPSGASTYTLTNSGATGTSFTVSPTGTTTYSIIGISASACPSTNTVTTTITVNTTPTVAIASVSSPVICSGNTSVITPSGASTYTLTNSGATGTSFTVNPTGTTTYSIIGTSASACPSTNTITTTITVNTTPTVAIASVSSPVICSGNTSVITPSGASTYTLTNSGATGTSFTVNPTGTTTYSIIGTSASACASTNTITTTITVNTTPTVAIASVSSPSICNGANTTITPSGATSYTLVNSGATGTSFNVSPTGTTTYSIIGTSASACPSTNTVITTITVNAIPTSTASTTGSVTCVTNTVNLNSTLAGMNYTWTAPGGSSITGSPNLQNAVGQGLGTYTLNIMSPAGCTYSTTIAAIQNTTAPTSVNAGPNQTLICGVATVTLTGSATPGTATANWLGGVTSPTSFTTTTGSANTYTLQAINPATGCFITSTVQVVSSVGSPSATANAVTNSITCTNSVVAIGITPTSGGPFTYQWTTPGISGATTNATATATLAGVYNVTLTNSPGNNCSIVLSITVPSNTTAVGASITPAGTITCNTPSLTLNASPTGASYTYTWSGSSAVTNGSTQNPGVTAGGTYSVAITNTVNGCVGNANITVASNTTAPSVNIASPSVTTTCSNPTVTIVATSTPSTGVTYNWTAPGSGSLSQNNISNPVASGSGIFTVVVTNTTSGCSSSLTQNTVSVSSSTAIPTATLSANALTITCSSPTVTATISTTASPVSYSWSPSAGIVPGTQTTANPVFNTAGSYSAVVTNTSSGCATSITGNVVTVTIDNSSPVITLSSGVNNGTITCTNTLVTISPTVSPAGNLTYTWSPGGVTSGSLSNATFTAAGVYTLAVTNTLTGCVTSMTNAANSFTVVANNTPPTFVLGTAPSVTATCAVPSVNLSGTSNADPNSVYTWTTPSSSTLVGNPISVSNPGIYTVAVTNTVNGCSSSSISQNTVEVVADAGIPVVTLSANSVSVTCSNPTPSVALSTTATPVTYSWSPTTGIVPGTETTANPVFNAAGSYSVVVTNTTSGCATGIASNVVNVTLDNTAPVITLTSGVNNGIITCTNTFVTISPTVTPAGNLTYTWSPGGGVTSGSLSSATFTAAGIYTLAITNTLTGCVTSMTNTANSFTVIANNATPSFTLGTASSVTTSCAAPSATLSASSDADPNSVYTWTTPATSTVTGNPLVVSAVGIYSVMVTNTITGCSTSATSPATVEVLAGAGVPSVTLSANSATITCSDPTPSVSITTTATPVTYSWSPTTGIVPGTETTANPVFNAAGTYSAVVTNTTSGCSTSTSGNVVTVTLDNTVPVITLSAGTNTGAINCINSQVVISPIVTPGVNLTYTWSPAGVISTAINNATFTASGVYTLAVTNTLTGCVSTSTSSAGTFTVTVDNTLPTASINVLSSNTSIGCGASNATVTLNGSNSTSANPSPVMGWLPGPVAGSSLPVTTAGTYTLVVVDAVNGCADSTQITVTGNTNPPQGVNAGGSANISCGSTSTILNGVTTTTNTSYSWAGPSGTSIISNGNTLFPTVGEVGDYTLTVTDNSTGCSDSSVVNVTQANATASITANPTTGISPLLVNFTGTGAGNPTYSWSFGDGNTSGAQNPGNTFTTGTYTVTLTTTSGSCTATATVEIVVEDGLTLEIPNVFTPNNDNANDLFTIKSTGVKEIALQVFNRWGEKLYEFTGAKASWDGLAPNSAKVPEGTYFYFVKATGFDGTEIEKHGTVNLFR